MKVLLVGSENQIVNTYLVPTLNKKGFQVVWYWDWRTIPENKEWPECELVLTLKNLCGPHNLKHFVQNKALQESIPCFEVSSRASEVINALKNEGVVLQPPKALPPISNALKMKEAWEAYCRLLPSHLYQWSARRFRYQVSQGVIEGWKENNNWYTNEEHIQNYFDRVTSGELPLPGGNQISKPDIGSSSRKFSVIRPSHITKEAIPNPLLTDTQTLNPNELSELVSHLQNRLQILEQENHQLQTTQDEFATRLSGITLADLLKLI